MLFNSLELGFASALPRARSKEIAQLLADHRSEAITCFFDPLVPLQKWRTDVERDGLPTVANFEGGPLVDFLINSLRSTDPSWRVIFQGFLHEQLRLDDPPHTLSLTYRQEVLNRQKELLSKMFANHGARGLELDFERTFSDLISPITTHETCPSKINALFVGDCVYEHLVTFLIPILRNEGVELNYTLATTRKMSDLQQLLEKLASKHFDIVCFSPYTHLFNVLVMQLIRTMNPLLARAEITKTARVAHQQTTQIIKCLVKRFDCTIAIQTTASILPESTISIKTFVKRRLSARTRRLASHELNQLLLDFLKDRFVDRAPIVVIDERAIAERFGETILGKHFYENGKHHPTVLGSKLAEVYAPLLTAKAKFCSKKLIAIDLDDTLWNGVIGEGKISHYHERQATLLELRRKGILLALVSKNDPKNVTWEGASLKSDDFVVEKINWDPKPLSIRRITEELNLLSKNILFIDDQQQQLEMVKSELPEVEVLNATSSKTWELMASWASILPEQHEIDRTQLYKEREKREVFLESTNSVDETALYSALGLKLFIYPATKKDYERVVELINRTNQFNTTAARTSLAQVRQWCNALECKVVVARCEDKFGDMGIISVMMLKRSASSLEIISWVLSCRVFGYGIEAMMLNYAKKVAESMSLPLVTGIIVKTTHNDPCKDVYADHQFKLRDGIWVSDAQELSPCPIWLTTNYVL